MSEKASKKIGLAETGAAARRIINQVEMNPQDLMRTSSCFFVRVTTVSDEQLDAAKTCSTAPFEEKTIIYCGPSQDDAREIYDDAVNRMMGLRPLDQVGFLLNNKVDPLQARYIKGRGYVTQAETTSAEWEEANPIRKLLERSAAEDLRASGSEESGNAE